MYMHLCSFLLIMLFWISENGQYSAAEDKKILSIFFNFEKCLANSTFGILFGSHSHRTAYDQLTVQLNKYFDKVYPIAIFEPKSSDDVQRRAVQTKIKLVPISGGHSYAELSYGSNDSIIIDFRDMKEICMNRRDKYVTVECGSLIGDLYELCDNGRLEASFGVCATIAIGGLTLDDNLVEIKLVDSCGRTATVNRILNTDLWWGVGPRYIAIVISVKLKLFDAKDLKISFKNIMKSYYEWLDCVKNNDRRIHSVISIRHYNYKPAADSSARLNFDENGTELHIIQIRDSKTTRNSELVHVALTIFPEATEMNVFPLAFKEFNSMVGYNPLSHYHFSKSLYVKKPHDAEFFDKVQNILLEMPPVSDGIFINFEQGKFGRLQSNESAYVHRDVLFNFEISLKTEEEEDTEPSGMRADKFYESVKFLDIGRTQNYPERDAKDYLNRFYGSNLARLVEIKRKWDHYFCSEMFLPINLP